MRKRSLFWYIWNALVSPRVIPPPVPRRKQYGTAGPNGNFSPPKPGTQHVESTSDERVINNTTRQQYRVLSDAEKEAVADFKEVGEAFIDMLDEQGTSRELSIAQTKMEEAVMWAVKHVTR